MDPRIRPASLFATFPRTDLAGSIPARFADQVARHGARLAIRTRAVAWTYEELDWASSRVAEAVLAALGARPHRVALLLGQGAPLVAAILGVLKAGHAYVALDPAQPRPRLEGVLAHARPGLCLADREHAPLAAALAAPALEIESAAIPRPAPAPALPVPPDAPAYLYYTSGSTGDPKGVLDTHRNVLHNVMRYTNSLGIGADDRLTLLQGPAFSGAVSSLLGGLLNGATVLPFDVRRDGPDRIADWLAAHEITMYHSVPTLFRRVAARGRRLPAVRVVRLEGDLMSPRDVELFQAGFDRGTVLVNGLGATECGLVRQYVIDHTTRAPAATVPIGYPVEDMDVVLLDPAGRPVAAGEVGEIVVRSAYLAVGYWDRPDLTAAAFGSDPDAEGRRFYRTGDIGRMAPDGCLEHLGRRDQQVKVHGERIAVEAIQAALLETGAVREAIVAARRDGDGDARLVAYLVPARAPGPTTGELRRLLSARLAGHPMPARFVHMDALPLDPNGKVDRRSLPAPDRTRPALDAPPVTPRTPREAALVAMWSDVLELAPVGVEDDFFELGGDSLLAVEMLTRVADAWGVEIGAADFAERPTIAAVGALLEGALSSDRLPVAAASTIVAPQLFFLHSDYGSGGVGCLMLTRQLDPDVRLVAVAPLGVDGSPVPPSIAAMAAAHLDRLRTIQPRGPYHLAGHCSAGVVAFEMAHQLRAAGETVGALVLVEPPPLRARRQSDGRVQSLRPALPRRAWRLTRHLAARLRAAAAARGLHGSLGRVLRARRGRPHGHEAKHRIGRAYADAVASYAPRRYGGLVTCVRTRTAELAGEFDPGTWRQAVDVLRVEVVPGNHETCLTGEARALAARLRAAVEGARSARS